jgi:hypothetical protein
MKTFSTIAAATTLLLIFPAFLFITSLFVRQIQPAGLEPAQTAQRIVTWFTTGPVWLTLWLLLMALPFAVFVSGCATLLYVWHHDAGFRQAAAQIITAVRAHLATLLVATATATAGGILAIVAVHALSD